MDLSSLPRIRNRRTGRSSSWERSGCNEDCVLIPPHSTALLADIAGPAQITHLWLAQTGGYRECALQIYYDDLRTPSAHAPLGDFFCLGNGIVNSFESALFSCSTAHAYQFDKPAALNCYARMPFERRAVVMLSNDGDSEHLQYFHVDFESLEAFEPDMGYFHAEYRSAKPFAGWGPDIPVNSAKVNVPNCERDAWRGNYVLMNIIGRGHYLGCNLSVANFSGQWWGEGDDMIWVDGYKWPPDLHGTGSEDYFGHGGGMQEAATLRNGSSIWEARTVPSPERQLWRGVGGYQTSYVFHLENPVRFQREIRVTIEHGHANHLANEVSSVAYWYGDRPYGASWLPEPQQRRPTLRDNAGQWQRS
jgi:hypothetical protein